LFIIVLIDYRSTALATLTSLRQLQYLVAVAERLNFTRAAQDCHTTQSSLSTGIRELERLLAARLVERDRQTVLMTPIGLEVTQRAHAILAATHDLVAAAAAAAEPMTGLLRLGVIPTIAPFLLPRCLRLLTKRFPRLKLALREDLTSHLLARLHAGELDFALIALPFDTAKLIVEPLFADELWVVGRSDDAALNTRKLTVSPSLAERMLLLEEGHCLRDHALHACAARERATTAGVEATSLLTLVQMIEAGLGIGLVPEMAVRSGLAASPRLVARPLAEPRPKRTIALVARRTTPRLAELTALAAALRKSQ
jgi:LysR family transcriptional regulator, hydrogen peroxide-inducible genes activator